MSEQIQRGEELFEKLSKDKKRRRNSNPAKGAVPTPYKLTHF